MVDIFRKIQDIFCCGEIISYFHGNVSFFSRTLFMMISIKLPLNYFRNFIQCKIFSLYIFLFVMQCYSTGLFQMFKHSIAKKNDEIILAVITTDSTHATSVSSRHAQPNPSIRAKVIAFCLIDKRYAILLSIQVIFRGGSSKLGLESIFPETGEISMIYIVGKPFKNNMQRGKS